MVERTRKPAEISQEDWDSLDVPEMTEADFARAKPFKQVFPGQYRTWKKVGRPPAEAPKARA